MNMQRTSGLGWIRSLSGALSRVPKAVSDPAEAGLASAMCGRGATRAQSCFVASDSPPGSLPRVGRRDGAGRCSSRRPLRFARAQYRSGNETRRGVLLWIVAALMVTPALAYADLLTVSVANQQETVLESTNDDSVAAMFTVALAGGTGSAPVVVDFAVSGTADWVDDYSAPVGADVEVDANTCVVDSTTCSGTLTIASLAATGTIEIGIANDDAVLEGAETLTVTLTGVATTAGTARLGTPAEATATIQDRSTVTVSVDVDTDPDLAEADAAEADAAIFTVALAGKLSTDVTVGFATADGTATAGVDYTSAASGASVVIAAGETTGKITVHTLDDMLEEEHETFTLTLSASDLPENVALGKPTATATIGDTEMVMALVEVPENVAEGTPVTFTVKLTDGVGSEDIVVDYEVILSGSGATAEDFEAPSGTITTTNGNGFKGNLTIRAGDTMRTLVIPTIADGTPGETLAMELTATDTKAGTVAPVSGQLSGQRTTTIGVAETVTVSVADASVVEGGTATFKVTLSETVRDSVTVGYSAAAAGNDNDFEAPTSRATVVIAAGRTEATFTVDTSGDRLAEMDETFTVELSDSNPALPPNVKLGRKAANLTIRDNDPLLVSVNRRPDTVVEGQPAIFDVTLSGGMGSAPVIVDFAVSGTAEWVADYSAPVGS